MSMTHDPYLWYLALVLGFGTAQVLEIFRKLEILKYISESFPWDKCFGNNLYAQLKGRK